MKSIESQIFGYIIKATQLATIGLLVFHFIIGWPLVQAQSTAPEAWWKVYNLNEQINSIYHEHGPVYDAESHTLWYTQVKPYFRNGSRKEYHEDIMSVKHNGYFEWEIPKHVPGKVNSGHHEGVMQLLDNGRKMLVFSHTTGGDISLSEKNARGKWSKPKRLKKINSIYSESNACISPDGQQIIFTSNRGDMNGHFDLYRSFRNEKGQWQKPEKLPAPINIEGYDEETPFIAADGTLYFSSNRKEGVGEFDVYAIRWQEKEQRWGVLQHLPSPINTPRDDMFFKWNAETQSGFFSSNRMHGQGSMDLYWVQKSQPIAVQGRLLIDGKQLKNKQLSLVLVGAFGEYSEKIVLDTNGYFSTSLTAGMPYKATVFLKEEGRMLTLHTTHLRFEQPQQNYLLQIPEKALADQHMAYMLVEPVMH